jgi:hypothetical protein
VHVARKDLLTRLADAGEDAISKLGRAPGMEQVLGFANTTRDRLDELTKRVRGIDELEKRVARLERQLKEASGGTARSRSTSSRKRSTSTRKTTSSRKSSSGRTGGSSPG